MDDRKLDTDMGDDEQDDLVRAYERYIEDPPANLIIRETTDEPESLGISDALRREWTRRGQAAEDASEDERPAEEAAMQIQDEPQE